MIWSYHPAFVRQACQKDTGGHPADSLGELFWRSELPGQAGESQRRGPQVRRLGRGLPGDHFWSLLGPSVLSIPLVTSWTPDDSRLALLEPPGPFCAQYSIGTSLSARSVFSLCSLWSLCGLLAAAGCSWLLLAPRWTPPADTPPRTYSSAQGSRHVAM